MIRKFVCAFIIFLKAIVLYKSLAYWVVGEGAIGEVIIKILFSVIIIFTCK